MEFKNTKGNYVYILRCSDGNLYTGWTVDLQKRLECHNSGKGSKYTRARRPVEMVYFEELATKNEALRREAAVKKLSRDEKLKLIEVFNLS
ncbi:MAG: GIY-YIG nuclease family protein [Clostridia bacterium]|nr:GIY-YIG nuclease family protein [Clostridia bacterium]